MSLLEILIVIAILAILSTYLMPSYHSHIRRSDRLAAIASIYQAAQFIEQAIAEQTGTGADVTLSLPPGLERSPPDGKIIYQLTVHGPDVENGSYTITAKPMDTGPMRDDECGSYLFDTLGRRSNQIDGERTDRKVAFCWQGR